MTSTTTSFHLKHRTGWFAAGREVEQALTLLSDAAFKLFVWLCLHAERSRGSLLSSPAKLASVLGKTESDIRTALEELFQQGVCNAPSAGVIQIADRFWPYQRDGISAAPEELAAYIDQVKRCFLQRRCVQSMFTPADETLAAQLYRNGVSVVEVERAILLGSLRKYDALANHGGTPITSFTTSRPFSRKSGRTSQRATLTTSPTMSGNWSKTGTDFRPHRKRNDERRNNADEQLRKSGNSGTSA